MTWQAIAEEQVRRHLGPAGVSASARTASARPTLATESAADCRFPTQQLIHGEWFSPITSRVLVEVVALHRTERWGNMDLRRRRRSSPQWPSFGGSLRPLLPVVGLPDLPAGDGQRRAERGQRPGGEPGVPRADRRRVNNNWVPSYHYRGSVSYVTGTHSVKVGLPGRGRLHPERPYYIVVGAADGVPQQDDDSDANVLDPSGQRPAELEPGDVLRDAVRVQERSAPRHRPLRAGQVDDEEDDVQLRPALRLLHERVPGSDADAGDAARGAVGGQRRQRHHAAQHAADLRDERGAVRLRQPELEGHHAALRHRVRPAGRRQDRHQGAARASTWRV